MTTWTNAAVLYYQLHKPRDGLMLLQEACTLESTLGGDKADRVRLLASMGIAHLSQIKGSLAMAAAKDTVAVGGKHKSSSDKTTSAAVSIKTNAEVQEWKALAEDRLSQATRMDQLYPMTWVGKGMLNVYNGRVDQARYFFETTLKHIGPVLPALLGMAAVEFAEGNHQKALALYGNAIQLYPVQSGASVRVGFGMCCYKLGQVCTRNIVILYSRQNSTSIDTTICSSCFFIILLPGGSSQGSICKSSRTRSTKCRRDGVRSYTYPLLH